MSDTPHKQVRNYGPMIAKRREIALSEKIRKARELLEAHGYRVIEPSEAIPSTTS